MAEALSRLQRLGLYDSQDPEPEGQEFGHTILEDLPATKVCTVQVNNAPIEQKHYDSDDVIA